jgi:hypothetical protein
MTYTLDELNLLMDQHNICVWVDPWWNPTLGRDKWLAGHNLHIETGFGGSDITGPDTPEMEASDVQSGATPLEAVLAVLKARVDSLGRGYEAHELAEGGTD